MPTRSIPACTYCVVGAKCVLLSRARKPAGSTAVGRGPRHLFLPHPTAHPNPPGSDPCWAHVPGARRAGWWARSAGGVEAGVQPGRGASTTACVWGLVTPMRPLHLPP